MYLKNFFISLLGALAAFWISIMLVFIMGVIFLAGSIVSAISGIDSNVGLSEKNVMIIPLDGAIEESRTTVEFAALLNNQDRPRALDDILRAIAAAKEDDKIKGIYLKCYSASAGIATRKAIRDALLDFQKSGKWVVAYSDSYSQGDYYVASMADNLFLNPVGMVDIHGLGSMVPFFKGLFDKLGVEMQVVKVGTYKSAVEPYILTSMSEPSREQTQVFLDNIWSVLTNEIHSSRDIPVETLNQMADSLVMFSASGKAYVEDKLVDDLKYEREADNFVKSLLEQESDDDLQSVYYDRYLQVAKVPHEKSNSNKIAVYYAFGDIVDYGKVGISAERMVPDIVELAEDEDIQAMVLRVNSGGGSAFASEQIWEALKYFKSQGKKLYVSMGDYAASGGYYISCGADKIYAEPVTLTGSIGIFGMMPCVKGLTENIGVNFSTVSTNANSIFPTITEPMTPFQYNSMQKMVNNGYELFTKRCADGRHIPQDSIKKIGEGRVWDGRMARKIGLVDQLGGLDDAVSALASAMNYSDYEVVSYPNNNPSFWDMVADFDSEMKARALRDELGAIYPVYLEYKSMVNMTPVQARVPFMMVQ